MATNPYFLKHSGEQDLIESMTVEIIKTMGQDCVYIPREYLSIDKLFGEDPGSAFQKAYTLEMYMVNYQGFDGTDIVTQFGIEIKDKITLLMARKRFKEEVINKNTSVTRPREGDLIYFPTAKSLFEINFVEHENPFYPLGKLYSYLITAELFTYSYEKINTKNTTIDSLMTSTRGLSGSQIIPKNNVLGTTAGINDVVNTEALGYTFNANNPFDIEDCT
ncbi:hypothetical protein EBU91_01410 [bacterium]|nr:hypothetical protein [bacterium]